MSTLDRLSAEWAWRVGRDAIAECTDTDPTPTAEQALRLTVFDLADPRFDWWWRGFRGEPFVWEQVAPVCAPCMNVEHARCTRQGCACPSPIHPRWTAAAT